MHGAGGIGARFHLETRYGGPPSGAAAPGRGGGPASEGGEEPSRAAEPVRLPEPEREARASLWEALRSRRSVRSYKKEPLLLGRLSTLLWASGGESGRRQGGFRFRTAPSAGALYPIETYLAARTVEDLAPGLYRYLVPAHALELLRRGEVSGELAEAALGQEMVREAAACFVWTGVVRRTTGKYRERGYRYIYMEAGIACENLHLAATALGLGACAVGAFRDDAVERVLGIDGEDEIALLLASVGPRR